MDRGSISEEGAATRRVLRQAFVGGFRAPLRLRGDGDLEVIPAEGVEDPGEVAEFTAAPIDNPDAATVAQVASLLNDVVSWLRDANLHGQSVAMGALRRTLRDAKMLEG